MALIYPQKDHNLRFWSVNFTYTWSRKVYSLLRKKNYPQKLQGVHFVFKIWSSACSCFSSSRVLQLILMSVKLFILCRWPLPHRPQVSAFGWPSPLWSIRPLWMPPKRLACVHRTAARIMRFNKRVYSQVEYIFILVQYNIFDIAVTFDHIRIHRTRAAGSKF